MTDRIRLTISVSPEVHEVFSRMAETAGMSLGKCMGDWLGDTIEGAQFVAQKMEEARRAPKTVMREFHAYALGLVDETAATMEQMRRAPAGRPDALRAPSGRPKAGTAPSSNTGLNPPGKTRRRAR